MPATKKRHRARPRSTQLTLAEARKPTGRGGPRPGAGRPRGRRVTPHDTRPAFAARHPQHITLRVRPGLASLRRDRAVRLAHRAILAGGHKPDFRVVHFNLLSNHVHLVVEATDAVRLARGVQGLAIRLARSWNRQLGRRGKLFAERYHARCLKSPRQVRNVLRYVLLNQRHHAAASGERLARRWIDPCSSAAWFDGWARPIRPREPWLKRLLATDPPTAPATVWLLTTGWRRHGLLAADEVPGPA